MSTKVSFNNNPTIKFMFSLIRIKIKPVTKKSKQIDQEEEYHDDEDDFDGA